MSHLRDKGWRHHARYELYLGLRVIRFASLDSNPDMVRAWSGAVIFDHNTVPNPNDGRSYWRQFEHWQVLAKHVNARLRDDRERTSIEQ